jgi:hypothetical protein
MVEKAKDRGYNPAKSLRVEARYIEDGKRSGRPKGISEAAEQAVVSLPDHLTQPGQPQS